MTVTFGSAQLSRLMACLSTLTFTVHGTEMCREWTRFEANTIDAETRNVLRTSQGSRSRVGVRDCADEEERVRGVRRKAA